MNATPINGDPDYSNTGCICDHCLRPVASALYVETDYGRFYCCDDKPACQQAAKKAIASGRRMW